MLGAGSSTRTDSNSLGVYFCSSVCRSLVTELVDSSPANMPAKKPCFCSSKSGDFPFKSASESSDLLGTEVIRDSACVSMALVSSFTLSASFWTPAVSIISFLKSLTGSLWVFCMCVSFCWVALLGLIRLIILLLASKDLRIWFFFWTRCSRRLNRTINGTWCFL